LTGDYANADWGYNAISNGGGTGEKWRTMTAEEVIYLFTQRHTSSGIRYAKAKVNDVCGLLIFPDTWNCNNYAINYTDNEYSTYDSNIISNSDWLDYLEIAGVVFLPSAGSRGESMEYMTYGEHYLANYWTATSSDCASAYSYSFSGDYYGNHFSLPYYGSGSTYGKWAGLSVRLVQDASSIPPTPNLELPTVIIDKVSVVTSTAVKYGGTIVSDGGDLVTNRGICWSTSSNPTIDNEKIDCGSGTGMFSVIIEDLAPNTT